MAERSSLRAIETRRRKTEGERRVRFHGEEFRNAQIPDGGMGPRVSPQSKSCRAEGRHPQSDFGRNSKMPRRTPGRVEQRGGVRGRRCRTGPTSGRLPGETRNVFFQGTATSEIYTLSLHAALPI